MLYRILVFEMKQDFAGGRMIRDAAFAATVTQYHY